MNKHWKKLAIILSDNARSRAYIDQMVNIGILPSVAILVKTRELIDTPLKLSKNNYFDNETSVEDKLLRLGIALNTFDVESFNDAEVVKAFNKLEAEYVVFGGPAGCILSKAFFISEKKILHVHPGRLPEYRGSTPMYYSLIKEGTITMSAFIMSAKLDSGEIVLEQEYKIDDDRKNIDLVFDPYFRAVTMANLIAYCRENKKLPPSINNKGENTNYYIIHPFLKHVAILGNNKA